MASQLPSLQYLDLRFNNISPTALTHFATSMTLSGSSLKEVSIDFYYDEKTEHCDWDGTVVESFYGQLYHEDITRLYLAGAGLRAVAAKTLYF